MISNAVFLSAAGWRFADVDLYLFHQPSVGLLSRLMREIGVDPARAAFAGLDVLCEPPRRSEGSGLQGHCNGRGEPAAAGASRPMTAPSRSAGQKGQICHPRNSRSS